MRLHPAAEPEEPGFPPGPDEIVQWRRAADREAVEVLTGTPVEVGRVEDRTIGDVPVRAYVPATAPAAPRGAIVYLHGGGWVFGSITTLDGTCRRLADRSTLTVVSVGYRLAPEDPWPAAVVDGEAVLAALAGGGAEVADLGADPRRIVVAGDSAGGFLAAVLARRARDAGRPPLAGQALVYPVIRRAALDALDDGVGAAAGLSAGSMRWYWDQFLAGADPRDAEPGELDPLTAGLAGLAPALVLTAEHDILCAEGEAYADALQDAGVDVTADRLLGLPHGFLRQLTVFPQAGRTIDHIAAWARDIAG